MSEAVASAWPGGAGAIDAVATALLERLVDPEVDEVFLSAQALTWVGGAAETKVAASPVGSREELAAWLLAFARAQGVRLDASCGTAGGVLAGEALRWHCVLPPLARDGPVLAVRRHRFGRVGLADFAGDLATRTALATAVRARADVLVAGPTGSGKTTLVAALLAELAADERVVSVEALPELPPTSMRSIRLVERAPNLEGRGGVSLRRLVREALRLRPDRLVVGEIRGREAGAFVEALETGHGGLIATVHAASPEEARRRVAALASGRRRPAAGVVDRLGTVAVAVLARGRPPRLAAFCDGRRE
jgi:pilus assembly protein CpaF